MHDVERCALLIEYVRLMLSISCDDCVIYSRGVTKRNVSRIYTAATICWFSIVDTREMHRDFNSL